MDATTPQISPAGQSDLKHHLHPYTQLRQLEREGPLVIVRGEGVNVFDEHGNGYIEGMAGLWCASLGFSEKRLADAAYRQMTTLPYYHSFSGKVPGPVAALVDKLIEWAPVPMARVLFANSGSEANDTAFKLVRYYNNARGRPLKKKIIARNKGYHGVTMAAASLSGLPMMHQHFDLPLPDVVRVSCPHFYQFGLHGETQEQFVDRLAQELEDTILREGPETVAAFIAEPVQGAGGVVVPPANFWPLVRKVCDKHGVLLIADEVVTGFGRTGHLFGTRLWGVQADMWCLAKGISSGYVPLGATAISSKVATVFAESDPTAGAVSHGYTYSAHPVAAAAALATLEILGREDVLGNVQRQGEHLMSRLQQLGRRSRLIGDVRGIGLMACLEMVADKGTKAPLGRGSKEVAAVAREAYRRGAMVRTSGSNIILSPALTIERAQVDLICDALEGAFAAVEA